MVNKLSHIPKDVVMFTATNARTVCFETGEILRYAASWNKSTFDIKEVLVMSWA